jgi:hypothetical protein
VDFCAGDQQSILILVIHLCRVHLLVPFLLTLPGLVSSLATIVTFVTGDAATTTAAPAASGATYVTSIVPPVATVGHVIYARACRLRTSPWMTPGSLA